MVRHYIPKTHKWRDVRVRLEKYGISARDFGLLAGITSDEVHDILYRASMPDNRLMAILALIGYADRRGRESALRILHRHDHEWRPIPLYSRYEASADGRIRRGQKELKQFRDKGSQRFVVTLFTDDKQQNRVGVHRAVCMAFYGPPEPPKHCACHKNGDPDDNRADNLYWGSHQDNANDRVVHMVGRAVKPWFRPRITKEQKMSLKQEPVPGKGYAKTV